MAVGRGVVGRMAAFCRHVAAQVVVSVIASVCVSALFAGSIFNSVPAPTPSTAPLSDSGKSMQRIADGSIETTTLRYDPQQQAALASLASFTPTAAPVAPAVSAVLAVASHTVPAARPVASVLPPPRPTVTASMAPAASKSSASASTDVTGGTSATAGWQVAGFEIPGSVRLRQLVPTGTDILHTGDAALTASAQVVRKVANVKTLLGL